MNEQPPGWTPPADWPAWLAGIVLFGPAVFRTFAEQVRWVATFIANRADKKASSMQQAQDAFTRTRDSLMEQLRRQMEDAGKQLESYAAELEKLRRARVAAVEPMAELAEAAVAARLMVHHLQDRVGEPRTIFPPLPLPPEER